MVRIVGVVLIVLGVAGLAYRGFNYTKETHQVKLGPLEMQVEEKKRVEIPVWVGAIAVLAGAGLLAFGPRR